MSPVHLFYETLDWKIYLKYYWKRNKELFLEALREDMETKNLFLTNSGRTGITLSLRAAKIGRNDEIFVPYFLSDCVLSAVASCGCPSLEFTEKTKAILLYHHWGYPQNFPAIRKFLSQKRRKILIIEDCAHGLWGESYGIRMGKFGQTALFSLAKIFKITYAGALRVNDRTLLKNIVKNLNYKVSLKEYWETIKGEWVYVKHHSKPDEERKLLSNQIDLLKWYATLIPYPACKRVSGQLPKSLEEVRKIFMKQNNNFLFLLKNLKNKSFLLAGDNLNKMAPLCYPFFSEDETILKRVNKWLQKMKVTQGIYHFDINRNMFHPNYKKCVPIPIYASIDKSFLESFVRKFKGAH